MNESADISTTDGTLGGGASQSDFAPTRGIPRSMHAYEVQHGDSPAIIARKYGVSVGSLLAANPKKPAHAVAGTMTWKSLAIGETLNVPRRHGLHGEIGLGYTDAVVNAAKVLDNQLACHGCCGSDNPSSLLSNAVKGFKQAILSNPSDWGSPGAFAAPTVTGSTIDVTNPTCQTAFGNGTISDLKAALGSAMTYTGGACATWNGAGNCPSIYQDGPDCAKILDCDCANNELVDSVTGKCAPMCPDNSRQANGACAQLPPLPATIPCPPGTVKAGQQVANILTDCGGVSLPCPQGTVREGQPIGMDPTCGGQKPGVDKCPAGTIRAGQDVGTDTACGGSALPCAPGTVREGQAIAMDPLCGGPKQKAAKDEACPAGQIRQGGQCITPPAPSGGGSRGSNAALVAGGLIVVGGIAATVFAMRKRKS